MSRKHRQRAMNRPVTRRYVEKQLAALKADLLSAIVHTERATLADLPSPDRRAPIARVYPAGHPKPSKSETGGPAASWGDPARNDARVVNVDGVWHLADEGGREA